MERIPMASRPLGFLGICIAALCCAGSGAQIAAAATTPTVVDGGDCSDIPSAINSLPSRGGRVLALIFKDRWQRQAGAKGSGQSGH